MLKTSWKKCQVRCANLSDQASEGANRETRVHEGLAYFASKVSKLVVGQTKGHGHGIDVEPKEFEALSWRKLGLLEVEEETKRLQQLHGFSQVGFHECFGLGHDENVVELDHQSNSM